MLGFSISLLIESEAFQDISVAYVFTENMHMQIINTIIICKRFIIIKTTFDSICYHWE